MMKLVFVATVALVAAVACGGDDSASDSSASTATATTVATATATATAVATADIGSGDVFQLEVGQCFDDPDEFGVISDVEMIDCAEPHDNEVYALFDLPAGPFPGVSIVEGEALEGCMAAFEPYVGLDYASSILDYTWLTPTPRSWENDDREIVCVLYDLDLKKLTESMKDSGV